MEKNNLLFSHTAKWLTVCGSLQEENTLRRLCHLIDTSNYMKQPIFLYILFNSFMCYGTIITVLYGIEFLSSTSLVSIG